MWHDFNPAVIILAAVALFVAIGRVCASCGVSSLHLTIGEIERLDPDNNRTVGEVRALLRQFFPVDPTMPAALASLLHRIP